MSSSEISACDVCHSVMFMGRNHTNYSLSVVSLEFLLCLFFFWVISQLIVMNTGDCYKGALRTRIKENGLNCLPIYLTLSIHLLHVTYLYVTQFFPVAYIVSTFPQHSTGAHNLIVRSRTHTGINFIGCQLTY